MTFIPTARRQTISASTGQALARTAEAIQALGISTPEPINTAVAELWEALERIKTYRANANQSSYRTEVTARIADGTATIAEIMAAASQTETTTAGPYSPMNKMFDEAERLASKKIHAAFAKHADKWVTQTLRPKVEEHLKTITEAIPDALNLDPRQDPRALDPFLYQPAVAAAWGQLCSIYKIHAGLRGYGAIPSTLQRNDLYWFKHKPEERDGMQDGDLTWFMYAVQRGHEPGLYTETDIAPTLERLNA